MLWFSVGIPEVPSSLSGSVPISSQQCCSNSASCLSTLTMLGTDCCSHVLVIKHKAMTESPAWSVMLALVAVSHLLIQKYEEVDIMSQGIINKYFHSFMSCKLS